MQGNWYAHAPTRLSLFAFGAMRREQGYGKVTLMYTQVFLQTLPMRVYLNRRSRHLVSR